MGENNTNETTEKGIIFKIYKQLMKSIPDKKKKKKKKPNKKVSKRPEQTFLQRRHIDG